jgi:hypothetical protein
VCNSCPHAQRIRRDFHLYFFQVYNPVYSHLLNRLWNPRTGGAHGPFSQTEILTMYKPNFCAECGSRVERSRWRLWTSRRFCSDCAPRFHKSRLLFFVITSATFLGLGFVAGLNQRPTPPPLIVERHELAGIKPPITNGEGQALNETVSAAATPATMPETTYGPDGTATERPTEPDEVISICGARTQKGTPCKRRVRGTGRCWQHKGMPAIIRNTVIN